MINTAKAEPGCVGVVFGLGGIGLNVIQGLRMIGARMIVGVDMNDAKKPGAKIWHDTFSIHQNSRMILLDILLN